MLDSNNPPHVQKGAEKVRELVQDHRDKHDVFKYKKKHEYVTREEVKKNMEHARETKRKIADVRQKYQNAGE